MTLVFALGHETSFGPSLLGTDGFLDSGFNESILDHSNENQFKLEKCIFIFLPNPVLVIFKTVCHVSVV